MLSSDKIKQAFEAICEEADNLEALSVSEEVKKGLRTIKSIARHQSDIRHLKDGPCPPHATC